MLGAELSATYSSLDRVLQFIDVASKRNRFLLGKEYSATLDEFETIFDVKLHRTKIWSGDTVHGWTVPEEWIFSLCRISSNGRTFFETSDPMRVNAYSGSYFGEISGNDLLRRINIGSKEGAFPYTTSYYEREWGINLTPSEFREIVIRPDLRYVVEIKSKFQSSFMEIADVSYGADLRNQTIFSSYLCHPRLVTNELVGPAIMGSMLRAMSRVKSKSIRHGVKFVLAPETIGSIFYINRILRYNPTQNVSGVSLTCLGAESDWHLVSPIQRSDSLYYRIVDTFDQLNLKHTQHSFLCRRSDERQYDSALVRIPMYAIMTSLYGEFSDYHQSTDLLGSTSTVNGITKTEMFFLRLLNNLVREYYYVATQSCEPKLSSYGLYPKVSKNSLAQSVRVMRNILALSDGTRSIDCISKMLKLEKRELTTIIARLFEYKLLSKPQGEMN